jgi:hypothetical protein
MKITTKDREDFVLEHLRQLRPLREEIATIMGRPRAEILAASESQRRLSRPFRVHTRPHARAPRRKRHASAAGSTCLTPSRGDPAPERPRDLARRTAETAPQ